MKNLLVKFFLIVLVLISCSSDNDQVELLSPDNLRVKSLKIELINKDEEPTYNQFEYDENGKLIRIYSQYFERVFSYNEKGQLIDDGNYRYEYNDFGNIYKMLPYHSDDNIVLTYDQENQLVTKALISNDQYRLISEFTYDTQNNLAETEEYILNQNNEIFSFSYHTIFQFESGQLTTQFSDTYFDGDFIGRGEIFYNYTESLNPINLIYRSLNVDQNITLLINWSGGPGTIPLSNFIPYRYFSETNLSETVINSTFNTTTTYEYNYEKYTYPSFIKVTDQVTDSKTNIWEYTWKYEDY